MSNFQIVKQKIYRVAHARWQDAIIFSFIWCQTQCAQYAGSTKKIRKKLNYWNVFLNKYTFWFNFSQELTMTVCYNISCLLCSCWFTGLITQPETGKPGSDCLREQTVPWTADTLPAVKHCLFPVTISSGFVTAPSRFLSLGQNVASTSSPLYPPALWS